MVATRTLLALFLVACDRDKSEGDSPQPEDTGEPALPTDLAAETELLGIANLDDDDLDLVADFEDDLVEGDNDAVALTLDPEVLARGATVEIGLSGDLAALRVWSAGAVVLDELTATASLPAEGLELSVEYGEFNVVGTLSFTLLDADGAVVLTDAVDLQSAPLILNHHLQTARRVAMLYMAAGSRWGDNEAMHDAFEAVLGEDLLSADGEEYSYDVWVQDELEFGTSTTPDRQVDVVVDSIRNRNDRYLDNMPEDLLSGPDVIIYSWGEGGATSQDSFGNLEISPPVTVNGVHYPYGRIYYGDAGAADMNQVMQDELIAQQVQEPFVIDVSWLCVGHVDEFTTFVPDSTAPKGFRFLVADVPLAYALLDSLDASTELPKFDEGHGYATIGDMAADETLRAYNEELQTTYIDPAVEVFKAELGLDDEDIIRVPGIFEKNRWCGGVGVSLIPGTLNMTVVPRDDGSATLFLPDPFLRADVDDQGSDPLIASVEALLPAELDTVWVDDWDWYHMMLGEVHCGTNTQREQTGQWWDDARHLMGAEEAR